MLFLDDLKEEINSGICYFMALLDALIDSWISSMMSLFLFFPWEEVANYSRMDYFMNPEPEDAAKSYLIDSFIPLSPE